jgi:hypothetical protein
MLVGSEDVLLLMGSDDVLMLVGSDDVGFLCLHVPGFPFSTQMAVLLSSGSKGHLATPLFSPGMYSWRPRFVRFA